MMSYDEKCLICDCVHPADEPHKFNCPSCKSKGFEPSKLGPNRCTYCDGTFGGNPPTEQEIAEAEKPKPWIEHLSNEHGVFKRIRGTFEFITKAGDFRYGDFVFILENGAIIDGRSMLNWYDSFLALARLEPSDVHAFLAEINSSHAALQKSVQDAHGAFMEEKYPGWRGGGSVRRSKAPPEEVKSETINVEDLGL